MPPRSRPTATSLLAGSLSGDDLAAGSGSRRHRAVGPRPLTLLLGAALLLAQLVLGAAGPAAACACGAFIDPEDARTEANVLQETAVLSLREGTETLVMGISLDAERTGSTLLMPTPSVPEVTAGQSGTLREMARATAPREVVEYDLWGGNPFLAGSGDGAGGEPEGAPTGAVTVHEQERIGDYEVAVLGGEAEAVSTWLAENGYALQESVEALIGPYAEDGWTFTAVRYASDAVLSGDLAPLRFDFATDELVYPMRFSQAAATTQSVHLFVIGDEPMRRTDGSDAGQQVERPWIEEPARHDWSWSDATLREMTGADLPQYPEHGESERQEVVTEFEIRGEPESFTTDFTFGADPEAEYVLPTMTVTEEVQIAGIPVGYLLVLAGAVTLVAVVVAAVALTVVVRGRRRARS